MARAAGQRVGGCKSAGVGRCGVPRDRERRISSWSRRPWHKRNLDVRESRKIYSGIRYSEAAGDWDPKGNNRYECPRGIWAEKATSTCRGYKRQGYNITGLVWYRGNRYRIDKTTRRILLSVQLRYQQNSWGILKKGVAKEEKRGDTARCPHPEPEVSSESSRSFRCTRMCWRRLSWRLKSFPQFLYGHLCAA